MEISAYLNFDGTCREAFTFYESCLGGTIETMMTFEGTPMAEAMAPEMQTRVLHARMKVGSTSLLGSDSPANAHEDPRSFAVSLEADSVEEAERVFAALAEHGAITMPMGETFWAERFGMCTDRWGIPWMVNCNRPAA